MNGFALFPVFIVGLLGSVHCVGMCGGIVSVFSMTARQGTSGKAFPVKVMAVGTGGGVAVWPRAIAHGLSYNAGRIASYAGAGAIAGGLTQAVGSLSGVASLQSGAYWLAWPTNLLLVAIGLTLAGAWQGLARLENAGRVLWRRLQPLTRHLLPLDSLPKAMALGALWGWLPCGMVYGILLTAMLSGSALSGALVMTAFGLGTLPALLAAGVFSTHLKTWMRHRAVRVASGMTVLAFGLFGMLRAAEGQPGSWLDAICVTAHAMPAPASVSARTAI